MQITEGKQGDDSWKQADVPQRVPVLARLRIILDPKLGIGIGGVLPIGTARG
jgi:hypothetical protein